MNNAWNSHRLLRGVILHILKHSNKILEKFEQMLNERVVGRLNFRKIGFFETQ